MSLPRTLLLLALTTVAAAAAAPAAHAAVTATIADPAGDVPASFDQVTDLTGLRVAWDGTTLTVGVTYAAPPVSPDLDLLVASQSASETDPNDLTCDPEDAEALEIHVVGGEAALLIPGVGGALPGTVQQAGAAATYTFTSPTLTRRVAPPSDPFACVSGTADRDDLFGTFDGKVVKLTPATAQAGATAALAKRFGTAFSRSLRKTVICPAAGVSEATDESPARALCRFDFVGGRTARFGYTSVLLLSGVPTLVDTSAIRLPAAMRYCGQHVRGSQWTQGISFGASLEVWAQKVPCATARRVALRAGGKRVLGFRCTRIGGGYESVTTRCTKPGGRAIRVHFAA